MATVHIRKPLILQLSRKTAANAGRANLLQHSALARSDSSGGQRGRRVLCPRLVRSMNRFRFRETLYESHPQYPIHGRSGVHAELSG